MPICSFANLLLGAGVPTISPVYLPSREGTTRALAFALVAGVAEDVAGVLEAAGCVSPLLRLAVEHALHAKARIAPVAIRSTKGLSIGVDDKMGERRDVDADHRSCAIDCPVVFLCHLLRARIARVRPSSVIGYILPPAICRMTEID